LLRAAAVAPRYAAAAQTLDAGQDQRLGTDAGGRFSPDAELKPAFRAETCSTLLRYPDSTRRVLTGRNRDDERRRFCRFLAATATHRYAWHPTCSRRVSISLPQARDPVPVAARVTAAPPGSRRACPARATSDRARG